MHHFDRGGAPRDARMCPKAAQSSSCVETLLRSCIKYTGKSRIFDENHRFTALRGDFLLNARFTRGVSIGLRDGRPVLSGRRDASNTGLPLPSMRRVGRPLFSVLRDTPCAAGFLSPARCGVPVRADTALRGACVSARLSLCFFLPRRDWMRAFFSASCAAASAYSLCIDASFCSAAAARPMSLTAHTAQPFLPIAAPSSFPDYSRCTLCTA